MNPNEINYYYYINNVNHSIQNILELYRLQHQTISSNNYYYNYNNSHFSNEDSISRQESHHMPYVNNTLYYNNLHHSRSNNNTNNFNNNYNNHNDNNYNNNDNNNDNNDYDNDNDDFDREFDREFDNYRDNLINQNITSELFCNIDNPINRVCPITQETFRSYDRVGIINHCNHIFKYDALYRWIRENYVCPMCRYDIRGITNDPSREQPINVNDLIQRITTFIANNNTSNHNRSLVIRYHIPNSSNNTHEDNNTNEDNNTHGDNSTSNC